MASKDAMQQHLVHGGDFNFEQGVPLDEIMGAYNGVDPHFNNPMQFGGDTNWHIPQTAEDVRAANAAQSAGLDSGMQSSGVELIDMTTASANEGGADGGRTPQPYGPRPGAGR